MISSVRISSGRSSLSAARWKYRLTASKDCIRKWIRETGDRIRGRSIVRVVGHDESVVPVDDCCDRRQRAVRAQVAAGHPAGPHLNLAYGQSPIGRPASSHLWGTAMREAPHTTSTARRRGRRKNWLIVGGVLVVLAAGLAYAARDVFTAGRMMRPR